MLEGRVIYGLPSLPKTTPLGDRLAGVVLSVGCSLAETSSGVFFLTCAAKNLSIEQHASIKAKLKCSKPSELRPPGILRHLRCQAPRTINIRDGQNIPCRSAMQRWQQKMLRAMHPALRRQYLDRVSANVKIPTPE